MTPLPAPRALVVINGDDVYEDLFSAGLKRFLSHGPPPHESRFQVETDQRHPVTRSTPPFGITHEHYQIETADDAEVIAWRGTPAGREPVAYTRQAGRGRVCYLQLGHDMRAWDDPPVREIVTRAARWAHGEETR
jgi:uncharacterized protein